MSKFAQDTDHLINPNHNINNNNGPQRPTNDAPRLTRTRSILIAILSLLALTLFSLEISHNGRANINLDLDQTPLDIPADSSSSNSPNGHSLLSGTTTPSRATPEPEPAAYDDDDDDDSPPKTQCTPGNFYASCFNDIRYFECAASHDNTFLLAHPCPAGQKFFCIGEGRGKCAARRATRTGEGYGMRCNGEEELGACVKVVVEPTGYE
jgi:hypothetical protein